MADQQLLDLFNQEPDFSNFIAAGNEIIVSGLQNFATQFTHIYGAHLAGKTHLLKAWANLAEAKGKSSVYIDATELDNDFLDAVKSGLYRFIAIDNIDLASEDGQIVIFDIFNYIRLNHSNNYLLTSASNNLVTAGIREDLKTRIYSGMVFNLKSLTDEELMNALLIYTKREGIKLGEGELNYLLKNYTRNLGLLIALINKVSQIALVEKKNITIPLLKSCMVE